MRFLILLPGEPEDPVQGLLLNHPLIISGKFPQYEVLSYAWASPLEPVDVAIGTIEGSIQEVFDYFINARTFPASYQTFSKVSVTQNLGRALPFLRLRDRPRVLWIDAISVNQKDLSERSTQVRRMADIYRLCSRVIIWLGEGTQYSDLAFETLELVRSKARFDFQTKKVTLISEDESDAHVRTITQALTFARKVQELLIKMIVVGRSRFSGPSFS